MIDPNCTAPFFNAAPNEKPIQGRLRQALAYVHERGCCECADERSPEGHLYATVCGLPMRSEPPDQLTLTAARLIMQEMAAELPEEHECLIWPYAELLENIMIFADACSLTDAQMCGIIERAYARAAIRLFEHRSTNWLIALH